MNKVLQILKPGKFYLDYGPMQMTLEAFKQDESMDDEIRSAAVYACKLLQELSQCLKLARIPAVLIKQTGGIPRILQNMIAAAVNCQDSSLTPMAAVAGAIADEVADYLVRFGATRVIINNGGDIALRITDDSIVRVGITSAIDVPSPDYVLEIDGRSGIGGIATSGLGGRGLTKGIASAAVCLAADGRTADACATVVANSTYHPHPGIKQVPAEELEPLTDISGQLVTFSVEGVDSETYQKALHQGMTKAGQFISQKLLLGAVLFTGGYMACEPAELKTKMLTAGRINSKCGGGVPDE